MTKLMVLNFRYKGIYNIFLIYAATAVETLKQSVGVK